jgi:hypothetical protein
MRKSHAMENMSVHKVFNYNNLWILSHSVNRLFLKLPVEGRWDG